MQLNIEKAWIFNYKFFLQNCKAYVLDRDLDMSVWDFFRHDQITIVLGSFEQFTWFFYCGSLSLSLGQKIKDTFSWLGGAILKNHA